VVRGIQFLRPGMPIEVREIEMPGERSGLGVASP